MTIHFEIRPGRWLLRAFGIKDEKPPEGYVHHKDPVAEYLDGQISAEQMDRELDRRILGRADVIGQEWR
jgi:hypothetical protein